MIKKQFIFGSVTDKIGMLQSDLSGLQACDVYSLSLWGIDFALQSYSELGTEEGSTLLAQTSLDLCKVTQEDKVLQEKLCPLFENFKNKDVQIATLQKSLDLAVYEKDITSFEKLTTALNEYIANEVTTPNLLDEVLPFAIDAVGKFGNVLSLRILFALLKNVPNGEIRDKTISALCLLSTRCPKEVTQILTSKEQKDSLLLYLTLMEGKEIDNKYKGQIALDTLSKMTSAQEKQKDVSKEEIAMQQAAIDFLTLAKWTRAGDDVARFLSVAKQQYQQKKISATQLSSVINAVATLSAPLATKTLIEYLDELNEQKRKEKDAKNSKNTNETEQIVFALVSALDMLSNKSAFDTLLAVTYLDYPTNIIQKAKTALENLKW